MNQRSTVSLFFLFYFSFKTFPCAFDAEREVGCSFCLWHETECYKRYWYTYRYFSMVSSKTFISQFANTSLITTNFTITLEEVYIITNFIIDQGFPLYGNATLTYIPLYNDGGCHEIHKRLICLSSIRLQLPQTLVKTTWYILYSFSNVNLSTTIGKFVTLS